MLRHLTSRNIKYIAVSLKDFYEKSDLTPELYVAGMKERHKHSTSMKRLNWITSQFLGIQEYDIFLRSLSSKIVKDSKTEQEFELVIILYLIIFGHPPESKLSRTLYKAVHNLDRTLLGDILSFFNSHEESISFISKLTPLIERTDSDMITSRIMDWQPHFISMYEEFESLSNLSGDFCAKSNQQVVINELPLAFDNDQNIVFTLNENHPKNSSHLKLTNTPVVDVLSFESMLENAEINGCIEYPDPLTSFEHSYDQGGEIFKEEETDLTTTHRIRQEKFEIKETITQIKRLEKFFERAQLDEIKWIDDILTGSYSSCAGMQDDLENKAREEAEKQDILELEIKHLKGLISFEDAVLAKKRLLQRNKRNVLEFMKEKDLWNEMIKDWKERESHRIRQIMEKATLKKLDMYEAKDNLREEKKFLARVVRRESEELAKKKFEEKRKELDDRIKLVNEMKTLSLVAKETRLKKVKESLQTCGFNTLCEMSIEELRRRIKCMKIEMQQRLDELKRKIRERNYTEKKHIAETKDKIKKHFLEKELIKKRETARLKSSKASSDLNKKLVNEEILELQRRLSLKRHQRRADTEIS